MELTEKEKNILKYHLNAKKAGWFTFYKIMGTAFIIVSIILTMSLVIAIAVLGFPSSNLFQEMIATISLVLLFLICGYYFYQNHGATNRLIIKLHTHIQELEGKEKTE